MQRNIIFSALLLLFSHLTFAQSAQRVNFIEDLFDNPTQVKWVKYYNGSIDNLNDVSLTIAFDGKNCKGTLHYLRSQETFNLNGYLQGNTLILEETDYQESVSGFIIGKIKNESLEGEWSNYNGSIASSISLEEVNKLEIEKISDCSANRWVRQYSGIIMWNEVNMILQHFDDNRITGLAYYKQEDKELNVDGYIDADGNFNLKFKNTGGITVGSLKGKENDLLELRAEYTDKSGERKFASFEIDNKLNVSCIQYADYMTSYEVIYPESSSPAFNEWMDSYIKDWVSRCRKHVKYMNNKHEEEAPDLRASERAYVWFDVVYMTDGFLSGNMTFSNTWSDYNQGRSINYDLTKGKEILWKDLFKKSKSFNRFLKNYIDQKIMHNPRYMDKDFRNWVKKEKFPLYTISRAGIIFSTNFNAIYGQQQVVVPYALLKPYLKKNNPIEDFID